MFKNRKDAFRKDLAKEKRAKTAQKTGNIRARPNEIGIKALTSIFRKSINTQLIRTFTILILILSLALGVTLVTYIHF